MKIIRKRGFDLNLMLNRLSEARTLNPDGSMGLLGLGVLDEFESYLRTAIEIEGKTDAFVRSIIKKAMHAEQHMTEDNFLKHCDRISHEKINRYQKIYKILFPVWGSIEPLSGRRYWNDVTITFDINKNSKFARRAIQDRKDQIEKSKNPNSTTIYDFHNLPLALCSVKGIDIYDAFEQAEKAISKELGLYSLTSSRGKFIFTSDPERPINNILIAPHMTVHNPNGAITSDIYWYNKWPKSINMKKYSFEEIQKIGNNVEKIRSRLKYLPWRKEDEIALIRHYSAFSQCDLESSFLDGWRLLELIGGEKTEQSDKLIRRAAWFFENSNAHYQIGHHLMERRNLISHGRPVMDESNEGLAFQMRGFITPFIKFFLINPFKFQSLQELWSFCDLPIDKKTRTRKAYMLHCSSKFRRDE